MRNKNPSYLELKKAERLANRAYIYGLFCPVDFQIKYIGLTEFLENRFKTHVRHPTKCNKEWVNFLKSQNKKPMLLIIEECNKKNMREREQLYINEYTNKGYNLHNKQIRK